MFENYLHSLLTIKIDDLLDCDLLCAQPLKRYQVGDLK